MKWEEYDNDALLSILVVCKNNKNLLKEFFEITSEIRKRLGSDDVNYKSFSPYGVISKRTKNLHNFIREISTAPET